MSLESCPACGYALAIVDQRCRHCSTTSGKATSPILHGVSLHLLLAFAAIVASILIYRVFLS